MYVCVVTIFNGFWTQQQHFGHHGDVEEEGGVLNSQLVIEWMQQTDTDCCLETI